jgi:hypothetical protein
VGLVGISILAIEPLAITLWRPHGQHVFLTDVAFAALCGNAIRRWASHRRVPSCLGRLAGLLLICTFAALAAHPSIGGTLLMFRLAGAAALAALVADPATLLATPISCGLLVGACGESAIAAMQLVHRGPLGLGWLGELPGPLYIVGDSVVPRGSFIHPYPLAAFALVAVASAVAMRLDTPQWKPYWLGGLGVSALPVGVTLSRMALLALLAVVAGLMSTGHARRLASAICTLLLAVGFGFALSHAGWSVRISQTVNAPDVDRLSSGRVPLMRAAGSVIRQSPVTGVGPARYANAERQEVNNVPLLAAAEVGVIGGLAVVALLVVLAARAIRGGGSAAAIFGAFLPFLLLDRFPWATAQGLALSGAWAGLLLAAARRHHDGERARPVQNTTDDAFPPPL